MSAGSYVMLLNNKFRRTDVLALHSKRASPSSVSFHTVSESRARLQRCRILSLFHPLRRECSKSRPLLLLEGPGKESWCAKLRSNAAGFVVGSRPQEDTMYGVLRCCQATCLRYRSSKESSGKISSGQGIARGEKEGERKDDSLSGVFECLVCADRALAPRPAEGISKAPPPPPCSLML